MWIISKISMQLRTKNLFYGQALPEVKKLSDWKWIINDITDGNMTRLEFIELSKKFATFFSQVGYGNCNSTTNCTLRFYCIYAITDSVIQDIEE